MKKQEVYFSENTTQLENFLYKKKVKKILLVTGKQSYEKSGAKFFLKNILLNYKCTRVMNFSANPHINDLEKLNKKINWNNIDCIIGIGGGSVIDMSKLLFYFSNANEIDFKNNEIKSELPIIAIPTTAGSGSEATHFSVIYDRNNVKHSIAHPLMIPDISIINYKLSCKMSNYQKAVSGLDAFSQAIESYWSLNSNSESRRYSIESLDLAFNNLKDSVINKDMKAHKNMVISSHLAGKAINIAKTTACHALSYYFTSRFLLPHGHAVALTLGCIYDYNFKKAQQSSNQEAILIFEKLNSILKMKSNYRLEINNFVESLGISLNLKNIGVNLNESDLLNNINFQRLNNNIVPLNNDDIIKIINIIKK
tara:strand:- start:2574 stop:3674 length:1101 start_codon:yes stop_codon:yes gene_type:complete